MYSDKNSFRHGRASSLTFEIVAPTNIGKSILTMRYRARHCSQCNGFVGFAVAKQAPHNREASVANFCLNCNHQLPVRSIVYGAKKMVPVLRRGGGLRLVHSMPEACLDAEGESRRITMETKISPADYARHLRAIGQELEARHYRHFNIEVSGDGYFVWVSPDDSPGTGNPLLRLSKSRLQKLWRFKSRPDREEGHDDLQTGKRIRYSLKDLDRIEREQRALRTQQSGGADGHRLSQLLRTVGDLVERKKERLLGIAWQELSVGIVVETPRGRKEVDVFRPDNLYDLWVKMYLRRGTPRLFDTPRS